MNQAFDRGDQYYVQHSFKTAFQDMEKQYLEILTARKVLFEFDKYGEPGIKLDLEYQRNDKMAFFASELLQEAW